MFGSSLDSSQLYDAIYQTLYMVTVSLVIGALIGIPLGILLVITRKNGIWPNAFIYHVLNPVINIFRSVPFIILLIAIVPFTKIQEEIYKNVSPNYVITIMRRMMYRIMTSLCQKQKAKVIINGESIGQVASQTLNSMYVINNVTTIPVIRPVACLDKLEIIDLAKKIDTYETSILPYEDCCTVFVPKHPIINPTLEETLKEEAKIPNYQEILDETIANTFVLKTKENAKDSYQDLL